jgi:RNA polymerase sigma-70 factor (ECF subfamily)
MVALQPRLLRFATSLAHNESDAEDLVQETYARALTAQGSFIPGTNLRAWLSTILRNLYISGRRRAALRPQTILDEADSGRLVSGSVDHDVERLVIARADLDRVAEAFRSLPPVFAAPLRLVVTDELSYAEVARRLDIPVGSVMSRVYRGRRLLAQRLMETS